MALVYFKDFNDNIVKKLVITIECTEFLLSSEGLICITDATGMQKPVDSVEYDSVSYIIGLEKVPKLKYITIGQFLTKRSSAAAEMKSNLRPVEEWPRFGILVERIFRISLPSLMFPSHLQPKNKLRWPHPVDIYQLRKHMYEKKEKDLIAQLEMKNICFSFSVLKLPQYIILWISDYLPDCYSISDRTRLCMICKIKK